MTIAIGTMRKARSSEVASESMPISGGDGTSPSRCITRIESPTAVARSFGATALRIAEFTGPVLMKMKTSATAMAGR